jgi:hypothetical protein
MSNRNKLIIMKVRAHLIIDSRSDTAIKCSHDVDQLKIESEEFNEERHGIAYRSLKKERTVVTVTFEVPDSVFDRPPVPVIEASLVPPNNSTPT